MNEANLYIIVKNPIDNQILVDTLLNIYDVEKNDIAFMEDLLVTQRNDARLVINHVLPLQGDFKQDIDAAADDDVTVREGVTPTEMGVAQAFCRITNNVCLISDEDVDPYTWILVLPNGETHHVEIEDHEDVNIITLREEYRHLLPSE